MMYSPAGIGRNGDYVPIQVDNKGYVLVSPRHLSDSDIEIIRKAYIELEFECSPTAEELGGLLNRFS